MLKQYPLLQSALLTVAACNAANAAPMTQVPEAGAKVGASISNGAMSKPAARPHVARPHTNAHAAHHPSVESALSKAVQVKIKDNDLAGAISILKDELAAHPQNAEALLLKAGVNRQIGDFSGAREDLDRLLVLQPRNVDALIQRAAVLRRLNDTVNARLDIDKAIELSPKSYQAYTERGALLMSMGDLNAAFADYNYALGLNPDLGKRAVKYAQPNLSPNTNMAFVQPDRQSIAVKAGGAEIELGKVPAQKKNVVTVAAPNHPVVFQSRKAPLTEPRSHKDLAALNNRAVGEINAKEFSKAIASLEELIKASPDYAHAKENLVIAHNNYGLELAAKRPREAIKQFHAALFLDIKQNAIRKNLESLILEMGMNPKNNADRLALAEEALKEDDGEGAYVESMEALRLRNTPEARQKMMRAIAKLDSSTEDATTSPPAAHNIANNVPPVAATVPVQETHTTTAPETKPPTNVESAQNAAVPYFGLNQDTIARMAQSVLKGNSANITAAAANLGINTKALESVIPSLVPSTTTSDGPTATPSTSASSNVSPTAGHEILLAGQAPQQAPAQIPHVEGEHPTTTAAKTLLSDGSETTTPVGSAVTASAPLTTTIAPKLFATEAPAATLAQVDMEDVTARLKSAPDSVLSQARDLITAERYANAEAILRRMSAYLRNARVDDASSSIGLMDGALEALAEVYIKQNQYGRAEPVLRELVALREKTKDAEDPVLGKAHADYSQVLQQMGQNELALKHKEKAAQIFNLGLKF